MAAAGKNLSPPQDAKAVLDYRTALPEANTAIVQTRQGAKITLPGLPRKTQWFFVVVYGLFGMMGAVAWAMIAAAVVLILLRPAASMIVPALVCAFCSLLFGLMALICWKWAFEHSPWGVRARSAGKLLLQAGSAYYLPSGTTRVFGLQVKPASHLVERIDFDRINRTSADLRIACIPTKWDRWIGHRAEFRIVASDPQALEAIAETIRSCPGIESEFFPRLYHLVPRSDSEQQAS